MKVVAWFAYNKLCFWSTPWIGSEPSLAVAQSWNLLLISALRILSLGLHRQRHWRLVFSEIRYATRFGPKIKVRVYVVEKSVQKDSTSLTLVG